ncbi:MAG: hypothetical protein AB7F19_03680 [Candidatus Babeliales bacterium]
MIRTRYPLLVLLSIYTQTAYSMEPPKPQTLGQKLVTRTLAARALLATQKQQQLLETKELSPKKPKTQTLYEHFKIQGVAQMPNELRNGLIAPRVVGEGEWWYVYKKLKQSSSNSDIEAVGFIGGADLVAVVTDNFQALRDLPCKRTFSLRQFDDKQVDYEFKSAEAVGLNGTNPKFAISEGAGQIIALDKNNEAQILTLADPQQKIHSITLHETEPIISVVTKNGQASLWDFITKNVLITLRAYKITCNAKKTCITTIPRYGANKAYIYNFAGNKLFSLKHNAQVNDVAFNPTQNIVATASSDGTVCLWNFRGEKLQTLLHASAVAQVKFPVGDNALATRLNNGQIICLWNGEGQKVRTLSHTKCVRDIAIHPQAPLFASATRGAVFIWLIHKPTLEQVLLRQVLKNWFIEHIIKNDCVGGLHFINFDCTSEEVLPNWIAGTFNLDQEEISGIWQTMPTELRVAIFKLIKRRVKDRNAL